MFETIVVLTFVNSNIQAVQPGFLGGRRGPHESEGRELYMQVITMQGSRIIIYDLHINYNIPPH
jgi:hypothetical protein